MREQLAVADAVSPGDGAASESPANLPPLEDLVGRIPVPVRELMEELFRAKFVAVRQIPASALK